MILGSYVVFMIFLATTKSIDNTADAVQYEYTFLHNDDPLLSLTTEPTFIYLSKIVLAFGGTISTIFFIYAAITIPVKTKTLYTLTPYIFTALVLYIPVYFELHDMIQIRASAASTCLLLSIFPLSKGQHWKAFICIICGILFHYSAAAYLPFLLIGNRKFNLTTRIIVGALVPVCFAMYLLKLDWFSIMPSISPSIDYKLENYKASSEKGLWQELYPLYANIYYLAKCGMLYLCLIYYDYLTKKHSMAPLLISLFAASVLFLPSMATIPVIASRISDLYGLVDCIVFTFLLYLLDSKHIARAAIAIVGFYMIIYNILFTEYFT